MSKDLNNIKKTGFKVPKDYFGSLEDKISNTMDSSSSLESINSTGFDLPEAYLNTVEDAVFNRLSQQDSSKVFSLFSRKNITYLSGIAAAALLIFGLFFNKNNITIENINIELVENYIINEDLDSYDIAALLSEDELQEELFVQNTIMDESLENYILENSSLEDLLIE